MLQRDSLAPIQSFSMAALCPSMLSQNAGASRSGARQEWWINPDSAPGKQGLWVEGTVDAGGCVGVRGIVCVRVGGTAQEGWASRPPPAGWTPLPAAAVAVRATGRAPICITCVTWCCTSPAHQELVHSCCHPGSWHYRQDSACTRVHGPSVRCWDPR